MTDLNQIEQELEVVESELKAATSTPAPEIIAAPTPAPEIVAAPTPAPEVELPPVIRWARAEATARQVK